MTSPRCTRAWSYSAQLLTRYLVLYLGWALDFMRGPWSIRPILRERLGAGSPQAVIHAPTPKRVCDLWFVRRTERFRFYFSRIREMMT